MKIQYLGTAAAEGWPALFCRCPACRDAARRGGKNLRTRSQAIIDDRILIDFCPDTLMHMYLYGIALPDLKTCLLTHTHDDHFYIEDLKMRCSWFASHTDPEPFVLYGNDELVRRMNEFQQGENGMIWTQGIAWKELKEYETAEIEGYRITPTIANHNPNEKCFNYILQKDGKTLFYGHDSGVFDESVWEHFAGYKFDYVSLDCTMLHIPFGGTHMNIDQCVQTRARMLETGCASEKTVFCVNHFSHNGAADAKGGLWLHEELEPYMLAKGFLVSFDGMTVEF